MKRHTTYPTTHPHWIDSDDDSEARGWRLGISFKKAFLIVLALHVAAIGGIYAYSQASPRKSVAAVAKPHPTADAGPKSDALARNEWPEPEAKPQVVATPAPVKKEVAEAKAVVPTNKSEPIAVAKAKEQPAKSAQVAKVLTTKAQSKPAPAAKPAAKEDLKKAFLATRESTIPDIEIREAIPVTGEYEPVVASNAEVSEAATLEAEPASTIDTPAKVTAVSSPSRPSIYTLAPGENLYMVSRKLQVSYNDLMKANGLTDPRQLRVGQKLKVPATQIASL
jgi:LysM repeat protein